MRKLCLFFLLCAVELGLHMSASSAPASKLLSAPIIWPRLPGDDEMEFDDYSTRVAAIQYLLRARGYYRGKIDGLFGSQTVRAVKAFQKSKKLYVDGIAGPKTLPLLVVPLQKGARGDAVRAVQILMRGIEGHNGETPNLGLEVDGYYGAETVAAVRRGQFNANDMEKRIEVNGKMSLRTWCLLLGGRVKGQEA